jgi:transcriptional regulator with XRE-family HTH domain
MYIVKSQMYTFTMGNTKKTSIDFSRNLKLLRKKKGLSQYDLADLTGFSQRMIAHYETHAIQPSLDKIEAIAKALGVKPADLLSTENFVDGEIDPSKFDTRSLKKLQDILSLPQNDRADLYRMLNRMLRENRAKQGKQEEAGE